SSPTSGAYRRSSTSAKVTSATWPPMPMRAVSTLPERSIPARSASHPAASTFSAPVSTRPTRGAVSTCGPARLTGTTGRRTSPRPVKGSAPRSRSQIMAKPRTGTMTQRDQGRWRLQVTGDPDPLTGRRRRLSRTVEGTRSEARQALQRLVVEAGAGLVGGATSTVATLLEAFMTTATLAPTTRQDWESVIAHHLLPSLGDLPLWKLTARD